MDSHATGADKVPIYSCEPKVHYAICCELVKASEKIISILPAIESARPGSSPGIQVLCSLNNTVEKSKSLVRYCSESSRFYLAITTESIASKCERIRTQMNQCLCDIQTMVSSLLVSQIAEVLVYLRNAKFIINPREEEAGKALSNLLAQIDTSEEQEFEAFQIASSRLNIKTSIALLVERRAIKKLLDKVLGVDNKKERILKYFLYLINKYGKQVMPHSGEQKGNLNVQDYYVNERLSSASDTCIISKNMRLNTCNSEVRSELFNGHIPPEEFCCPISSSLMFDPVVIASGQTYERTCIEKWFSEGHDTCPKTHKKLENLALVPNPCMKDLVIRWYKKHCIIPMDPSIQFEEVELESLESNHCNSVSSLKNISTTLLRGPKGDCIIESVSNISSLSSGSRCCSDSSPEVIETSNNNHTQLFTWSNDYQKYHSFSNFSQDMYLKFLFELSELPTLPQVKAVEDITDILKGDEVTFSDMISGGFAESLIKFLKKAYSLSDIEAQKNGAHILLALVNNKRWELNLENEDVIKLLSSFFNCGIKKEAMMILQKFIRHPNYLSSIIASDIPLQAINFINTEEAESVCIAVNILSDLSSHGGMKIHFLSSGCIETVGQLLDKRILVGRCLNILQNLCNDEEASMRIADSSGCIASIADILEFGTSEEREQAVTILLMICSYSLRNCSLVLKEGVIPSIIDISVTGTAMGKEKSLKLLHVLRTIRSNSCLDTSPLHPEVEPAYLDSLQPHSEVQSELVQHPAKNSKKISDYRYFGFFSRKMRRISKLLALL